MKNSSTYVVPFRRKREGKTNYKMRLGLLKSKKARLVVRKSLRYILAQIAVFDAKGDKIEITYNSKKLKDLGWNFSYKSIPAAYLSGLVIGRLAVKKGIKEAVLDLGLQESTKGNRIFALVKGADDAGLSVPVGENVVPSEDRIFGKHIIDYFNSLDDKKSQFSRYKDVEKMPELVKSIKEKILKM